MKKIISLTLALIILAVTFIVPASATPAIGRYPDKDSFVTDYPYVFVHGMGGWGPANSYYDLSPYWGGGLGTSDEDLLFLLNAHGVEAYGVQVGPLSSAWDRACEIYAQLTGTVTDYGEAHSKAHGHDRYGFSYEGKPLMDKAWNINDKIHIHDIFQV